MFSANLIKKKFDRGCQFLEELYIDLHSVHVKDSDNIFIVKALCAASLKQVDRWVIYALTKSPCNVYFAHCQCPAGTSGTCCHAYALMKMVTKWVADGLTAVPEAVACTSKPQYWSIPQSRGKVTKIPIPEMNVVAVGKESTNDKIRQSKGGRRSTLYGARAPCARITPYHGINELQNRLKFLLLMLFHLTKNHYLQ